MASLSQNSETSLHPELIFATDQVDEINDGKPIRPDIERPSLKDYWQEMLRQRQGRKPTTKSIQRQKKDKQPSKHRIDDYA